DRYSIERELGEGGMAVVYLAEDLKHHRKVALKVLKPELAAVVGAERFLGEIETTAHLQHPHILPLFDSGEADTFLFYVMPYVEGESLRDRLEREHQLPVDEAVRIARDLAEALDYAHRQGVIHRDIKPANILMHEGRPLIADFGIALAVGTAASGRMTETGMSLGTPYYMSPEQATGDQMVGPASDIYALGAVLYELLTGDPPYVGSTAQAVLGKILQGVPVSATEARRSVPPNVDAAIRRALETLPADRFTGAQEFAKALADPGFRHGIEAGATRSASHWNRLSVGMTAFAGALSVALGWVLLRPESPGAPFRYMVSEPVAQGAVKFGPQLALSPDGTTLAYVSGVKGPLEVWVRKLGQLQDQVLEGTEGAFQVFFSPSGRQVGFITEDRKLKLVSLEGGPPLTVLDSGLVRGGAAWGSDGYIYFARGSPEGTQRGGLGRVLATGGPIEPVTQFDSDSREVGHDFPEVLPSGRGVIFTVSRDAMYNPETMQIAVVDLQTGEHKILLPGVAARWSDTGHILVVREDGALVAVPFDQQTLEQRGPPVPVLSGVEVKGLPSSDLAISETGTLVYPPVSARNATDLVWVTRDGWVREVDPEWSGLRASPALSPDGTRLAVTAPGPNGGRQIWIKHLGSGPPERLTLEGTRNEAPTWAPDGRSVIFVSNRGGNRDVYEQRADGTAPAKLLLDRELPITRAFLSPDDEWLVFWQSSGLYARRVGSDDEPVRLTDVPGAGAPALSPDGRWLAFSSPASGQIQVYVQAFPDGGGVPRIVSQDGGAQPVWSHSGRELFYVAAGGRLMVVDVLPGEKFAPRRARPLFNSPIFDATSVGRQYDVSPDDRRFVVELRGGPTRLEVVQNFFEELKAKAGG
ncbi:MAG: protein kinase, partial [Gemmatimonadetes bacterium]|nr:protein kinase [Gemmatimonadota bacterium]